MASTYLSRTQGTPTNSKKWTISFWMKGKLTDNNFYSIFGCDFDNGDSCYCIGSGGQSRNEIGLSEYHGSTSYGQGYTDASLRDSSGWYHIVFSYDSTQATASDRGKTYINGVFNNSTYATSIPLNHDSKFNTSGVGIRVGNRSQGGGSANYDGCLSHFHFIDGTAYQASDFGQYDANGVWTIKTSPSVTYGTNGFFILKDGNSVTDQSGNSNNFTVAGGTLTNTEDNPSNVFATFNPLAGYYNGSTFSNGNNTVVTGTTQYSYDRATLGASSGKYYWEIQYAGRSGGSIPYSLIGISSTQPKNTTDFLGKYSYDWAYYVTSSSKIMNASTETSYGTSYGDNDIIGVAMDLDNYKLYFSKNGTWQNSGDPTSGSTGTGAISIVNPSTASYGIDTPLGAYFPAVSFYDGGVSGTYKANFGNGYFGTTAVSSAGTNASGIGIFEYDVPTGFTALSTKGLNL